MAKDRWVVGEYRGLDGLRAVEADWRRLYDQMPHPAMRHSFEAFSVFLDTVCPAPDKVRFVTLSDGERVRAIMPIEERSEPGLGVALRVWGVPWNNQWRPNDVIALEDDAREALLSAAVQYLRRQPRRPAILVIGPSSDESVLWRQLDRFGRTQFSFNDGAEYVMPANRSCEEFISSLSSKFRTQIRKAIQRFEALPGATYVRAVDPRDVEVEFEHLLCVEGSGWKGERGTAINQHPEVEAFYRGLTERLVDDGHCEINALHAEGKCIAAELCIQTRRHVDRPKGGYDEEYAFCAPGKLVTHKGLEWSCEDPSIDVLSSGSDAPWLQAWHPIPKELRRAYVSLRPVSGRLVLALLRFRYGPLRRLVRTARQRRAGSRRHTQPKRGRDAG